MKTIDRKIAEIIKNRIDRERKEAYDMIQERLESELC